MPPPRRKALLLVVVTGLLAGCRAERYYGPYRLELPGPLRQSTAVHTFLMPLQTDVDQRQQLLEQCQQQGESDCLCRYPLVEAGRYTSRVDYAVHNLAEQTAALMVWVGYPLPEELGQPEAVPGWPEVELLAEHHHRLAPGQRLALGFTAEELELAEGKLSSLLYPECGELPEADRPGLELLLLGVSDEQSPGEDRVVAEFTVLVDAGGWP